MKVLIVSGFLGAGKTYFIQDLIKKTQRGYVILENEFADSSVDGQRLKNTELALRQQIQQQKEIDQIITNVKNWQAQQLNLNTNTQTDTLDASDFTESANTNTSLQVMELSSGCICCSSSGDFASNLLVIENSLRPDYLIVEPSGVSVLSKVLNSIKSVEYQHIQILPPVVIVDACAYYDNLKNYQAIFSDQLKNASVVQLSKVSNFSIDALEQIKQSILKINPNAQVHFDRLEVKTPKFYQQLLNNEQLNNEQLNSKQENQDIKLTDVNLDFMQHTFKQVNFKDIYGLVTLLERAIRNYYGKMLRAKGTVSFYNQ